MSCQRWIKQGYLYLANELNETDKKQFEKHLANCEFCQTSLNENRILWDDLHTLKQVKPSRKLRRKISEYARDNNKKISESWIQKIESYLLPKRPVLVLAYAVVILIASVVSFRSYRYLIFQKDVTDHLAWEDDFFIEASFIDDGLESIEMGTILNIPNNHVDENKESWLSPMTDDLVELRQSMQDVMTTLYGI